MNCLDCIASVGFVIGLICIPFGLVRSCTGLGTVKKSFGTSFIKTCSRTTQKDDRAMRYGSINDIMSLTNRATLYSLALSMLKNTSPYTKPVEKLVYTFYTEDGEETFDFCRMLKRYLAHKRCETDGLNSHRNNCRKCIEEIEKVMIHYLEEFPGTYSAVQHHRNVFGEWLLNIVDQYGQGMEFELPKELQYENENQNTAVLLLKELQNREGVTKKDLEEKLRLKPRQIAKDLRKLDHSLIETPEAADMSDYVPFRIGGQPVKAKISAVRKENRWVSRNLTICCACRKRWAQFCNKQPSFAYS